MAVTPASASLESLAPGSGLRPPPHGSASSKSRSTIPVRNAIDLGSLAYTPGVAQRSARPSRIPELAQGLTPGSANVVAVVSPTANRRLLGLGDIGPAAAMHP
ncbi:hypothetical protein GCM10020219_100720 [Nonomuraea dietziae]